MAELNRVQDGMIMQGGERLVNININVQDTKRYYYITLDTPMGELGSTFAWKWRGAV